MRVGRQLCVGLFLILILVGFLRGCFIGSALGSAVRITLRGLPCELLGLLLLMVANQIRPELDDLCSYDSLGSHGESVADGVADGPLRSRVVGIGNCSADQVADHVGVVWS